MKQRRDVILASGSPRRRELFSQAGIEYTVMSADVDETPTKKEPGSIVEELSERKAEAAYRLAREAGREALIVAADTIVSLDGRILGKPGDKEEAIGMLRMLSGRTHQVYTGVTLLFPEGRRETFSEMTEVCMYPLSPEEIVDYVNSGEPMDKAGAYGIQGLGARLVERIRGDYNNVVGFPLARFIRVMVREGELIYEE